jgi:hypothetical protein
MALPKITFNRGTAGLGRPLPGKDHYSGMVFFLDNADLPSGFSTSVREKKIFSLAEAEALGIVDTHIDATAATGSVQITAVGADGDTIEVKVTDYSGVVSLGTYTKITADNTVTLVGEGLETAINAGTSTHGYTANNAAGTVTITAPKSKGVGLNSGTPISTVIVGTITATITQFSAGAASEVDELHYHISQFFRVQPKGVLYVGIYAKPGGAYTFAEVSTLFNFAQGEIRQVGVYAPGTAFTTAKVTTLDGIMMANEALYRPASAIVTMDLTGILPSALTDLSGNSDYRVSVDIAQDGAAKGLELYKALGKTIGSMGAMLGMMAFMKVNESIAWVGKSQVSDGVEFDTPAFGDGTLLSSVTTTLLDTLTDYKYVFFRKFGDAKTGTWFNDSGTAIISTNDFAYIENVRTMDKAIRGIYTNTLDKLNAPILLNSDGTLTEDEIAEYERLASIQLDTMLRDREISAYKVEIDPAQDVLSTSEVEISIFIVPTGTARFIKYNVSFVQSVA